MHFESERVKFKEGNLIQKVFLLNVGTDFYLKSVFFERRDGLLYKKCLYLSQGWSFDFFSVTIERTAGVLIFLVSLLNLRKAFDHKGFFLQKVSILSLVFELGAKHQ